jgi:hypothetical protein
VLILLALKILERTLPHYGTSHAAIFSEFRAAKIQTIDILIRTTKSIPAMYINCTQRMKWRAVKLMGCIAGIVAENGQFYILVI